MRLIVRAEGRSVFLFIEETPLELLEDICIDSSNFSEGRLVDISLIFNIDNNRIDGSFSFFESRNSSRLEGSLFSNLSGLVAGMGFVEVREGHGLILAIAPLAASVLVLGGSVEKVTKHSSFSKNNKMEDFPPD